jgi:hypothetical protein
MAMIRRRPFPLAVAIVALATSAPGALAVGAATHEVFKCRGDRGVPTYQGSPCEPGRTLRDFSTEPANVSVIPFATAQAPESATRAPDSGVTGPVAHASLRRDPRPSGSVARPSSRNNAVAASAAERRHLHEGMTESEVRARVGPPDAKGASTGTSKGAAKGATQWSYLPAPDDPSTLTTVRFEKGRVVAVDRTVMR